MKTFLQRIRRLGSLFRAESSAEKVVKFPQPRAGAKWFEVRNATDESADIYLYDVIGGWDGTDAKAIIDTLKALKSKKLNVHINSPGGSVFDGIAIYNALAAHPSEVTTHIDGLAASIASIIALAGKRVLIAENAMMMIHNPWVMTYGDSARLRKDADVLDQIKETLITTYATRTGIARDEIAQLMTDETWFTAADAVKRGFADESVAGVKAAACTAASFDLSLFGYAKADAIQTALKEAAPVTAKPPAPQAARERKLRLLELQTK